MFKLYSVTFTVMAPVECDDEQAYTICEDLERTFDGAEKWLKSMLKEYDELELVRS